MVNVEEVISDFKEHWLEKVKEIIVEFGGLPPSLAVLCLDSTTETGISIQLYPVPGHMLNGDSSKEYLAKVVIPTIAKDLKGEENFLTPICISWSTEIWIRQTEQGVTEVPDNWKDLPKTEGILITFETEDSTTTTVFKMERKGKIHNSSGEEVDEIILTYHKDLSADNKEGKLEGRFVNLFKNFTKTTS